jgi:H+/Cl- antiporter ClcA
MIAVWAGEPARFGGMADEDPPRSGRLAGDAHFVVCLIVVALGAAAFAIVFRTTLSFIYWFFLHADNVLEAHLGLNRPARVIVLTGGGLAAGAIAARARRSQGVSNVMEAIALGTLQLSLATRSTTWRSRPVAPARSAVPAAYPIVLPLLLATFVATAVSRRWKGESVYAAELRQKGVTWELTLEGRRVRRQAVRYRLRSLPD